MTVVYFFIVTIALLAYLTRKESLYLLCVFGMMTRLFMLDTSIEDNLLISGSDLAIILFIVLLPIAYNRDRRVFSINGDPLTKWVYVFILFYWIELFFTVASGRDSFFNSIKVIRVSFVAFAFFTFKTISIDSFKKFLRIAFWITLIQGFLYLLQFAGIRILSGANDSQALSLGVASNTAINTPTLLAFYIVFLWKANFLKSKRGFVFLFFISLLFLSFVRGRIVAVLLGLAYLALTYSERSKRIPIILAFLLIIPIASRVIDAKSELSSGRGLEDIVYVFRSREDFTQVDKTNGTFSFRVAMLTERVVWLVDHPQYLLTGVGTMHEDSPQSLRMFHFSIGTQNEARTYGHTLIESGDITWVPITLRYGAVGLLVHIMMFVVIFNAARKRKDVLVVLAAYFIIVFAESFDGSFFERSDYLLQMILFFAMISRANYEDRPMLI